VAECSRGKHTYTHTHTKAKAIVNVFSNYIKLVKEEVWRVAGQF
jgi:hypothetical protein